MVKIDEGEEKDGRLEGVAQILLTVPTLVMVSTFSLLLVYMARLNNELRLMAKSKMMDVHSTRDTISQMINHHGLPNQEPDEVRSIKAKAQKSTSLLKMFLITANVLLYIFFVLFYLQTVSETESQHKTWLFTQWMCTLTATAFTVLAVGTLLYGAQLETTVTQTISMRSVLARVLSGLDLRVLLITLLVSLVFLARAIADFIFAFNLLDEKVDQSVIMNIVHFFSEVALAFFVVKLLLK